MLEQFDTNKAEASNPIDWVHKESSELMKLPQNRQKQVAAAGADHIVMTNIFKDSGNERLLKASYNDKSESRDGKSGKITGKYDTSDIVGALTEAKDKGLPLVVQIGETWCPHCQKMDANVWPKVEGSIDKSGSPVQGELQGKAIFLHIDYTQSKSLPGNVGQLAANFDEGVKGFPTTRVYSVDSDGNVNESSESVGEMSQTELLDFLSFTGIKKAS